MDLQKIEIRPFQTTSVHETYLLEISGRFFEIGKDTAELLTYFKNNGCEKENVEAYVKLYNTHSQEEVNDFLESISKKLDDKEGTYDKRKAFLYNKELLPASVINRYSSILKVLFNKWVMSSGIFLFVILDILYFVDFTSSAKHHLTFNLYILLILFFIFIFSSFFHELGHASACRYWGISHGGVGLGVYINIPVFYTDVSNVWKLSRMKRLVVNVGGVYFQMLFLLPFLATSLFYRNNIVDFIILTVNFNFPLTLNPFFKFDGYWIMTDLLGVANLRQRGKEWMQYILNKFRHKPIEHQPYLLSLSKAAKVTLVAYTLVVNLFFGFYFFYMMPQFFIRFYHTFPKRMMQLLEELSYRQTPDWANLQQIILQLFFCGLFFYMIYRTLYPLLKKWIKSNIATQQYGRSK